MGNEQSNPGEGEVKKGYHVLQVQSGSPGELSGLLSFFDFIIAANDKYFDKEESAFVDCLKQNIGKEVKLNVFNLKSNSVRNLNLVPSTNWGGNGLAGISIRYCTVENATELVWHVLDVYPNSPASNAGLQARSDYIVGTPDAQFNSSDDFYNLIGSNEGKPVPLYIYNTQQDRIRVVQIIPNRKWGGEGSMGCDVGFGFLHRIPLNIGAIPSSQPKSSPAHPGPVFNQQHYPSILQSVPVQLFPSSQPTPSSSSSLPPQNQPQTLAPPPVSTLVHSENQTQPESQPNPAVVDTNNNAPSTPVVSSNPSKTEENSAQVASPPQPLEDVEKIKRHMICSSISYVWIAFKSKFST
eukprot:TRINITY_DN4196_c0_g1_i2.p1 TRINITY_DN4196_c0_g1~~TRINITY_DN4196_c0_g1_i2.p1  ORF type:complete len:353 (+),score=128.39 TRINITY_DN4196_c0_g1_i2:102-1160(+)